VILKVRDFSLPAMVNVFAPESTEAILPRYGIARCFTGASAIIGAAVAEGAGLALVFAETMAGVLRTRAARPVFMRNIILDFIFLFLVLLGGFMAGQQTRPSSLYRVAIAKTVPLRNANRLIVGTALFDLPRKALSS
jgi:hypothetical protein